MHLITVFLDHMFTIIEYIIFYHFKIKTIFLLINMKETVILLIHEYLNTGSTNEHKICRSQRMQQDVYTRKLWWSYINI